MIPYITGIKWKARMDAVKARRAALLAILSQHPNLRLGELAAWFPGEKPHNVREDLHVMLAAGKIESTKPGRRASDCRYRLPGTEAVTEQIDSRTEYEKLKASLNL